MAHDDHGPIQVAFFNLAAGFAGALAALVTYFELPDFYSRSADAADVVSAAAAHGPLGLAPLAVVPLVAGGVSGLVQWALYCRRIRALPLWLGVALPAAVAAALLAVEFYISAGSALDVTFARLAAVVLFVVLGTYATWFVLVFMRGQAPSSE